MNSAFGDIRAVPNNPDSVFLVFLWGCLVPFLDSTTTLSFLLMIFLVIEVWPPLLKIKRTQTYHERDHLHAQIIRLGQAQTSLWRNPLSRLLYEAKVGLIIAFCATNVLNRMEPDRPEIVSWLHHIPVV